MRRFNRLMLVAVLLICCVGCDQIAKHVVRDEMTVGESHSYVNDTLRLTYAENPGAFLSLGDSLPKWLRTVFFQGGVGLIVIALLWAAAFARDVDRWQIVALALLGAGGLGNLIDRVLYDGRVTDFLNIGLGGLRTGIFNIADLVEVIGVIVFAFALQSAAPSARPARPSHN
jgi:signal peptidase II